MIINRYVNEIPTEKGEVRRGEFTSLSYEAAVRRIKEQSREENKAK